MRLESRVSRAAAVTLAALLASVGLGACSGSESAKGSGTELSFFVFNEPSGAYKEAAKACSTQSGGEYTIGFEYLPSDADSQREQLVRRLGAEDSSIDIIGMDVIWTAEFANAGWIEPWDGKLAKQVTETVFPSVIEAATFEGDLYAAPFTSNTQLLWYRSDRVDKPPKTWDEMVKEAERIGKDGLIQVQAGQYEGYMVWVNAMIESAGTQIISGPDQVALEEGPTQTALETMGSYARSSAVPPDIDTSNEDTARLSFEAGGSSFMLNYPFVYPSAQENAPKVFKVMKAAKYPAVVDGKPSAPPLGGINLGVSTYSENQDLAFKAASCLVGPENQITAATLGGLPPVRQDVYDQKAIDKAYPGFAELIRKSIEDSAPRPVTPAYTDLSLAVQRALHPVGDIDAKDVQPTYDDLRELVEQAVKREGLL